MARLRDRHIEVEMKEGKLTHLDSEGQAAMVDVSGKSIQLREAVAAGEIHLLPETIELIEQNQIAKGNVLATARLAGIMAAKKTGELIPLCHPLPITHCEVRFEIPTSRDRINISASAKISAQTGSGNGSSHRSVNRSTNDLRHVQSS